MAPCVILDHISSKQTRCIFQDMFGLNLAASTQFIWLLMRKLWMGQRGETPFK